MTTGSPLPSTPFRLVGEFRSHFKPKGKGRPRFFNGHAVTPKATRQAEQDLALLAHEHRPEAPAEGPLFVCLAFTHPIPKSWPKWKREIAEAGMLYHSSHPDLDNQVKLVLDALNRSQWWADDRQVATLWATSSYGLAPGTHVRVLELPSAEVLRA